MPETNTAVDNGEPIEVTFESTLAEIAALNDQIELAEEALEELQTEAEDVQSVVRSAPLRVLVRRLNEVRAMLDSMGDGLTEAASSVEALAGPLRRGRGRRKRGGVVKLYTVQGHKYYGNIERRVGPFHSRALAEQAAAAMVGLVPYVDIVESKQDDDADESEES